MPRHIFSGAPSVSSIWCSAQRCTIHSLYTQALACSVMPLYLIPCHVHWTSPLMAVQFFTGEAPSAHRSYPSEGSRAHRNGLRPTSVERTHFDHFRIRQSPHQMCFPYLSQCCALRWCCSPQCSQKKSIKSVSQLPTAAAICSL